VRVLLLELPLLLRDMLEHSIQLQSDCELLKNSRHGPQVLAEEAMPPDIIVLGLTTAQDAALVPALFARWPMARVITLMQAGDDATVYMLRLGRRVLGQASPSEIVKTLRELAHESRELWQQ
jgi:DNA-binding NarL/FixJ family response regulator